MANQWFPQQIPSLIMHVVPFFVLWVFPGYSEEIKVIRDDQRVTIQTDKQTLCQYKYGEVPWKPFIEKLYTPAGVNILRDAPFDHLHHHGLMFAIKVDGINFWEEQTVPGLQKTLDQWETKTTQTDNQSRGGFTTHIDWVNSADGSTHLKEERSISLAVNPEPKGTVLSWMSKFSLPTDRDSAVLTGTNYHGLGIRFLASMDQGGVFLNAEGQGGVEGTNDKRSAWCAYSAKADGKPVTIAVFDHDSNIRFPATWFTMDKAFAYLSATLNLSKEPLEISKGKDLTLRYLVVLLDGDINPEAIREIGKKWLAQPFEIN